MKETKATPTLQEFLLKIRDNGEKIRSRIKVIVEWL